MSGYRRRLPHFQPNDAYLFLLTWRLWGSLAARVNAAATQQQLTSGHAFVAADRVLDRQTSEPLWLKEPDAMAESIDRQKRQLHFGPHRTGLLADGSFDHYLRNSKQLPRTVAYIEQNPVVAGLALSAAQWPWSSASSGKVVRQAVSPAVAKEDQ